MHTNREVNLRAGGKFSRKFNYRKQLCYLVFVGSSIDMSVTSSVAHFLLRTSQCQVQFLGWLLSPYALSSGAIVPVLKNLFPRPSSLEFTWRLDDLSNRTTSIWRLILAVSQTLDFMKFSRNSPFCVSRNHESVTVFYQFLKNILVSSLLSWLSQRSNCQW